MGTRTHTALDLHIWQRHVTCGIICVSYLLHVWHVPSPKAQRVGAIHVMPGMRGFWHVAMDLLFPSPIGGRCLPIDICCPSLAYP